MQRSPAERFDEIYRSHVEAIRAYVRRRVAADAVDDAVAETFVVCWRRLEDVPRDPLPWLYGVARKTLANQRRAEDRQARPLPAEPPPAAGPAAFEQDPKLGAAFASLSEADREVLRLVASWGTRSGARRARGGRGRSSRSRLSPSRRSR